MIGVVLFFAWRAIKRAESNRVRCGCRSTCSRSKRPPRSSPRTPRRGRAGGPGPPLEAAPAATIEGEITDLIERQPDEVAQTLRSWLADRRT